MKPCLAVVFEDKPGESVLEPFTRKEQRCIVNALIEHEMASDAMGLVDEARMVRRLIARFEMLI